MLTYYKASTLSEALAVLGLEGASRPLAGGTDLLVGLRGRWNDQSRVVDLKGIEDAGAPLTVSATGVRIGLGLTMAQLVEDPTVARWYPALAQAASQVGSVAIRNRATIVGNICNASPASDTAPALLVHEASVRIASSGGERTVPIDEFFVAPRVTKCGAAELVTAIELAKPVDGTGSAYLRLTRRRGVDLITVSVAAAVHGDGRVLLGLGAVGPRPLLASLPAGTDVADERALAVAIEQAVSVATPITDIRGGAGYRAAMLRELATRAIAAAIETTRRNG